MTSKLSLFLFLCAAGCYLGAADTPAETAAPPETQEALVISSLPDNIKLIIGQAKDTFYVPRVKAIHALPTNMPQDQIDACYDFLYQKLEKQSLPDLQFNGLKNELVFALMKQRKKPPNSPVIWSRCTRINPTTPHGVITVSSSSGSGIRMPPTTRDAKRWWPACGTH